MNGKAYDDSEYKMSNIEAYNSILKGNRSVSYSYFYNEVGFDPSGKLLTLFIDSGNEESPMQEIVAQYEKEDANRRNTEMRKALSMEECREKEKQQADTVKYNEDVSARMCGKYRITRRNTSVPFENCTPFNNVLSGATIELHCGEGILDFLYADFRSPFLKVKELCAFLEALPPSAGKEAQPQMPSPAKAYNKIQTVAENYFRFRDTMTIVRDIAYASLYSAVCPPLFQTFSHSKQALQSYYRMLSFLQKEYSERMAFCYDKSLYPDVLRSLSPSARYHLFNQLHNRRTFSNRNEIVSFYPSETSKEVGEDATETPATPTEPFAEFEEAYQISHGKLTEFLRTPHSMTVRYEFRSVAEILELEFTKLLELDLEFRKCKRCGRYFVMKGNYDTSYCDRVEEGQTRSCQALAAQEKYKLKAAENPALTIYSKYYKRYAARVRTRQIKEADFKKWKFRALSRREDCATGKITDAEYIAWMESCFPNRTKTR